MIRKIALIGFCLAASMAAQDLLVKNAKLITCTGPESATPVDVRVENGRITKIEAAIKAPARTPTIDAKGKVVMPAFVMAHTSEGVDRPNEVMDVVPFVSVLDSIDPTRPFFDDCLRDGVYTINIMPADRTVIGGMGRILRPFGRVVEDMTIVPDAGLKLSMIPPSGNRAAHMAKLRAALEDARRYLDGKQRDAAESKPTGNVQFDLEAMSIERRKMALSRVLKKELPTYVSCQEAGDVWRALSLAQEFDIDVRLVLWPQSWRAAAMVAKAKVPVILAPDFESEEMDPDSGKMTTHILPKILFDAGVEFSVTARPSNLGQRYLWYQAASLVRYGIPRDVALKSVTLTAAKNLGLAKSKGSLEAGKDADLIVLTADPLSGAAWVETGVIEGRVVYERRADKHLAEVLGVGGTEKN